LPRRFRRECRREGGGEGTTEGVRQGCNEVRGDIQFAYQNGMLEERSTIRVNLESFERGRESLSTKKKGKSQLEGKEKELPLRTRGLDRFQQRKGS